MKRLEKDLTTEKSMSKIQAVEIATCSVSHVLRMSSIK